MNSSGKRPGLLFTLVGPAGAGKNRLMKYVLAQTSLHQLPTATTRPIRPGEQQGREHHYVSEEEFKRMIEAGELLEHAVVHGNLYGMPRAAVEQALDSGQTIIADIDMLGDARARAAYPENVVSIFIQPPSIGSLIERMRERHDSEAEIGKRLLRVPKELAYAPRCDYAILNDSFTEAANKLYEIVEALLRGDRSVRGDELLNYRFSYVAQIVPVYGDRALRSESRFFEPKAEFSSDELPHQAALRALSRELNLPVDENALIGGDKPDGDYRPPVKLIYAQDASSERITYLYFYRLDESIPTPAGWLWVELSETLHNTLVERRSEA